MAPAPTRCSSTPGLGSEGAKRRFVGERLRLVGRRGETDGITVDSAGPSDSCRLPVTAVSNHNGQASEEVRFTCAVQRDTGLPLLFRHVAGNVIDVSTVTRTIAALGAMCVLVQDSHRSPFCSNAIDRTQRRRDAFAPAPCGERP